MARRPLRIGLSARIYHPLPGATGLQSKSLHYLEQSVAHWVMSREVMVFMIPSVSGDGLLHRSSIRLVSIHHQAIKGLSKGSARRYGFVHLGGAANRIALIGTHGTSLYIDFDKRLVVATFASHPQAYAPATLAVLEQAWKSIERGVVPVKKAK